MESANRNFTGRVNPKITATYLASPPLVVLYALAGTMAIDLEQDPVGISKAGQPVYLRDLWPSDDEIAALIEDYLKPEQFAASYQTLYHQNADWAALPEKTGDTYAWDPESTYIAAPPFVAAEAAAPAFADMRVLAKLGDSVTTDHISPAGFIGYDSPAGHYLRSRGVAARDFNAYGTRRGHHDVMMRGTLANIRLQNQLVPEKAGGFTRLPDGEITTIFAAAQAYAATQTPLVILAGKDYGMGSSRDWAAKGVKMLGVKAIIAESFERIHRANLVMMGIVPLQYLPGQNAATLGLTGDEAFTVALKEQTALVTATTSAGQQIRFETRLRFDTEADWADYQSGGILPRLVAQTLGGSQ